jgi:hypothetical protein
MHRVFVVALSSCAAAAALAGPLNPPAGQVSPTYKTLDEVAPSTPIQSLPGDQTATHVISEPGAYHLTGNLIGELDKIGVLVLAQAGDVLIDLRGFRLSANPNSASGDGVVSGVGPPCLVAVRNGVIQGWPGAGVRLDFESNLLIDGVSVMGPGAAGLVGPAMLTDPAKLIGPMFHVANSAIGGVSGDGINTGLMPSFIVENTVVEGVGAAGIVGPAMSDLAQNNVAAGPIGRIEGCLIRGTGEEAVRVGDIVTLRKNDIAGPVSTGTEAVLENNELWFSMDHPVSFGMLLDGGLHKVRWNRIRFTPAPEAVNAIITVIGNGTSWTENDCVVGINEPPTTVPPIVFFTGDHGEVKHSSIQGVPDGTTGFGILGDGWIVRENDIAGVAPSASLVAIDIVGDSNIAVQNTLRSGGANGVVVQASGLNNMLGPIVDIAGIANNFSPDRNLIVP